MSASTIARWNAIALERPADNESRKRPRSVDPNEDDDDDGVSLVSRSPTPQPSAPEKAGTGTEWYDDFIEKEVITVETKLKATNVGFALLKKMGWREGAGLGTQGEGRPDPIPFNVKYDSTGIGKASQDFQVIESTVASRRELDSERLAKETDEQRAKREAQVAQRAAIQTEVFTAIKPFYCDVCDKQYKNVAQYDEHCRGYAHAHKVREKETKAVQRGKVDAASRKEKERKREEKEMRKLAAAAGIKLAPTKSAIPTVTSLPTPPEPPVEKKSGWATVNTPGTAAAPRAGWATVAGSSTATSEASISKWSTVKPAEPSQVSGWGAVQTAAPATPSTPAAPPINTGFVSAGYTRLETTVTDAMDVDQPEEPPATRGGWASISADSKPKLGGWAKVTMPPAPPAPQEAPAPPLPPTIAPPLRPLNDVAPPPPPSFPSSLPIRFDRSRPEFQEDPRRSQDSYYDRDRSQSRRAEPEYGDYQGREEEQTGDYDRDRRGYPPHRGGGGYNDRYSDRRGGYRDDRGYGYRGR